MLFTATIFAEVKFFLAIAFLIFGVKANAQQNGDSLRLDSISKSDSLLITDTLKADTSASLPQVVKDTIHISLQYPFTSDSFLYRKRLFFSFTNPVRFAITEKTWEKKEVIFYAVIALLLFFAFVRNSFSRYLSDLYSSYFRTTLRQRQVKEQLLQSPLPSMLFNIFFIVSTSVFLSLVLQHFRLAGQFPFWLLSAYCALGLLLIYGAKFLVLKFFGWVFQMQDAADTYVFIVFSTNKIMGVALLPFTVLLAFTYGALSSSAATLGLLIIGLLFFYRYFLSFLSVNRQVRIDFFHFLIYLAAFEILPLLLINKVLLSILREIS